MADLSDDDLKLVLSVDPDMDALNKAIGQINAEIDAANVQRVKNRMLPAVTLSAKDVVQEKKDTTHEQLLAGILGGQGGAGALGQVGAMAGEALGGPLGAVAGEKVGETLGKMMPSITGAMQTFSQALQGMQGPLGPVGAGLDVMSAGLQKIAPLLGPFGDAIAAMPGFFKDTLTSLTSMAGLASPGTITLFNHALEDAQATIGQAFIPVVDLMRESVEMIADVMANILPNSSEMSEVLSVLREDLRDLRGEFAELMREFGPLIRQFVIAGIKVFVEVLAGLARVLRVASEAARGLLAPLQLLGLTGGEVLRSRTTAARQATIGGIEEYQRQLQLQTATGAVMPDVGTNVNSIATAVKNIEAWFLRFADPVTLVVEGIKRAKQEAVRDVRESISSAQDLAQGAAKSPRDFLRNLGSEFFGGGR